MKKLRWSDVFSRKPHFLNVNRKLGLLKEITINGVTMVQFDYKGVRNVFLDPEIFNDFIGEIWPCETCIFNLFQGSGDDYYCFLTDNDYPAVVDCSSFIPHKKYINRPIVYFSHSLMSYDSVGEEQAMAAIRRHFPNAIVINPKIIRYRGDMTPYLTLVSNSDILVFKRFLGKITSGVGLEIKTALNQNIPVYELSDHGLKRILDEPADILTREETVQLYQELNSP